jgi:hypothetical protein
MAVTYLAAHGAAFQAGFLILALGVPTVGWILLIVGLKQRSRSRPQSHLKRQARSKPAKGAASGTTLIVIGAVLLALGLLAIVARLASR